MKAKYWIQNLVFASLGLALIYGTFSKFSFSQLQKVLSGGNYIMVVPLLFISVAVILFRAWRWKLLYRTNGRSEPAALLFHVLSFGYLVNFAIPRLGEITRAVLLKEHRQAPINLSISTIVFERLSDFLALVILVTFAFLGEYLNGSMLFNRFTQNANWNQSKTWVWILIAGLLLVSISFFIYSKRKWLGKWISDMLDHFKAMLLLKERGLFLLYTFGIWTGFYLMTFLWIFLFPESAELSWYACFQVMVLGVIARTLPIQAGSAGAYHFVVSQAFIYLGIQDHQARALALIIHGFQSVLTLSLGTGSYIWLLFYRKKYALKD